MFYNGTKVLVIASSIKKSSPGPRIGSIGYASTPTIHTYLTDLNVVSGIINIDFIRYGFEQSERSEKRNVITIFPFSMTSNIPELISSTIESLNDAKVDKNPWKGLFSRYNECNPIGMVMAIPLDRCINLLNCSSVEFFAWLDSYIKTNEVRTIIKSASLKELRNHNFSVGAEFLSALLSLISDKSYRTAVIDTLNSTSPIFSRQAIMKTLKAVLVVYERNYIDRVKTQTINVLSRPEMLSSTWTREALQDIMLYDVYNSLTYQSRMDIIKEAHIEKAIEVMNRIASIKEELRLLGNTVMAGQAEV